MMTGKSEESPCDLNLPLHIIEDYGHNGTLLLLIHGLGGGAACRHRWGDSLTTDLQDPGPEPPRF
jgi:hypothetical protein